MSDRLHDDEFDRRSPDLAEPFPPLPPWLVRRHLRHGETVSWVYGPRSNPSWERYLTHPALFVVALVFGVVCLMLVRLVVGSWEELPMLPALACLAIVLGSIFVLAISAAYFTRLVVTTDRLLILQGYEVCRTWKIDDLPPSLIRYGMRGVDDGKRTVDLG